MKTVRKFSAIFVVLLVAGFLSGCADNAVMKNVNSGLKPDMGEKTVSTMLVLPDRSLGLEPTVAICRGDISPYMMFFPKRLYAGEWFPGRLRWNTWTILPDNAERFGQIIFSGMHPSGHYFGTNVIDGQVLSGYTAIQSSVGDYIYSPLGNELAVDREKFQTEPVYRREKIIEVNTLKDGNIFNVSSLKRADNFKWFLKTWNQLKTPDGYLLTPYGLEEVAKIRGINPQYTYFEKLVGTGKFAITPTGDIASFAIVNSIGILMDMLSAKDAPAAGWDFGSHISRRQMSFVIEYALRLSENEIQKRNDANAKLAIELKNQRR